MLNNLFIQPMKFSLIVAADSKNGIGKSNKLVWKLPTDMKHFVELTTRIHDPSHMNAVIMGRNTWESIPKKHRPLPGRLNVVLSRTPDIHLPDGVILANSLDDALEKITAKKNIDHVFVIGGAKVYADAINHPKCQTIYLTRITQTFDCDTFFPVIDEKVFHIKHRSGPQKENGLDFEFLTYERGHE